MYAFQNSKPSKCASNDSNGITGIDSTPTTIEVVEHKIHSVGQNIIRTMVVKTPQIIYVQIQ